MTRIPRAVLLAACLVALQIPAMPCLAASPSTQETERLERILKERFPTTVFESIVPSGDLPGYFEVITQSEIVYLSADGKRMILGNLMDVTTKEDLTAKRWNEINRIDFRALPFDKAIRIVKGNGSREMAIFEDPFCPYCEELEKNLTQVDNVTIHLFLYPLEQLHPGATKAANEIWCADDRVAAWSSWMVQRKAPLSKTCEGSPIPELQALGDKLRINSTPTVFFVDGSRVPGSIGAAQIEARLASAKLVAGKP